MIDTNLMLLSFAVMQMIDTNLMLLSFVMWMIDTNLMLCRSAGTVYTHGDDVQHLTVSVEWQDLCIHTELYFMSPDTPGHSYSRSSLARYSEAQRRVWEKEFSKPCTGFYRQYWSDNEGFGVKITDGSEGRSVIDIRVWARVKNDACMAGHRRA